MKLKIIFILGAIFLFSHNTFSEKTLPVSNSSPTQSSPSQECQLAISIAEEFLPTLDINPTDYKLIKIENMVIKRMSEIDPKKWYITFKARNVLPSDKNGILGVGGEIFIEVDLNTQQVEFLGVGE